MYAANKFLMHSTEDNFDEYLLDRLDGISRKYESEKHIYPSKYESRQSIVRRIYNALEKNFICCICGSGAISLAKKLSVFVKGQGLIYVAMVTVSKNPNLREIRDCIIQQIQLEFIDCCILILAGFWWELNDEDFEAIGIPSPSKSFKIVYTTRNEDMCKKNGSHLIFHVDFLEDEEAWDLFREKAGISIVDLDFIETVRLIVDECDCFRVSILTIASTLKDKPNHLWIGSVEKLQNSNRTDISEMEKVFSRIELSFDLLNDTEAQKLFLICCLFPEDYDVPVEDLVLFGKGLQLLGRNVDSMDKARDRVECAISKLKNSYFLLDGDGDDFVKVQNICREFGLQMPSEFIHPYVARYGNEMKEWPFEAIRYKKFRAISFMCKKIKQHPIDLKCPNLRLLQLSYGSGSAQLPNGIFEGLKDLEVLSLNIPSLLQSLNVLTKLRSLCITESISNNKHVMPRPRVGELLSDDMNDLQTLSFSTVRPYDDFPREIGLLHNLRYLRFNVETLKYIPPGVLSKLAKLEELYLPLDFINWGQKEEGGERMNASLGEIGSLQLTAIRIGVSKGSILKEKLVKNLTRFHVFIGSHVSLDYEFGLCGNSKKLLEVFDVDADDFQLSWISALVQKSETLRLKQVKNLKNIVTYQWKPVWKTLCISDCKELEYLAMWTSFHHLRSLKLFALYNLEEIGHGLYSSKIEGLCFSNLCEIQIMFCRKLKHVFSVSVATELRQLQRLDICFCEDMEAIFYRERLDNDNNQIASKGKTPLRDPTENTSIEQKSKLSSLKPKSLMKRLFGRGKKPKIVTSKQQVKMKESIGTEDEQDEEKKAIIFPQLKTIELAYMDKLRVFCDGNDSFLLPSLQSLSIFQCNHLEAFSHKRFETPSLEEIQVNGNRYSDLKTFGKNL